MTRVVWRWDAADREGHHHSKVHERASANWTACGVPIPVFAQDVPEDITVRSDTLCGNCYPRTKLPQWPELECAKCKTKFALEPYLPRWVECPNCGSIMRFKTTGYAIEVGTGRRQQRRSS